MKKKTWILVFFLAVCAVAFSLAGEKAPNPVGTWVGELTLNDGGTTKVTLILEKDGKGFRGTLSDETGLLPAGTKLESVSLAGHELKFSCLAGDNTGRVTVKITLKIDGDRMTGRWEDEQNGTSNVVELKRK